MQKLKNREKREAIIECALYTDNIKELWTFALINKRCSNGPQIL